jgi:hypothetical protein
MTWAVLGAFVLGLFAGALLGELGDRYDRKKMRRMMERILGKEKP